MIAAGIDIGGTKIETQLFDESWQQVAQHRCPTPKDYPSLVQTVADQIAWAEDQGGKGLRVGLAVAGLINPATGLALTANLAATGHPFPADIKAAAGRSVTYLNDCKSLAVSEAAFGAGVGHQTVMAVILGTGVGGGLVVDGVPTSGPSGTGGEFGHSSAPAHLIAQYDLPLYPCGCGRMGCIETYISGPGLARLAKHVTGQDVTPPQIAAQRGADMAEVWAIWCALAADMLRNLILTADPDVIVLGGGLSHIDGISDDLAKATKTAQIGDFGVPPIAIAQGGDASGARGAAYAAWRAMRYEE